MKHGCQWIAGGATAKYVLGAARAQERGAARNRGAKAKKRPGQRLAWPGGAWLGGGMSGGYPHAGALKWAVRRSARQKRTQDRQGSGWSAGAGSTQKGAVLHKETSGVILGAVLAWPGPGISVW